VAFDNGDDRGFHCRVGIGIGIGTDILLKLSKVAAPIPDVNVIALNAEGLGLMAERFAMLLKFKHVVVDVVAVIKRDVTVNRFGTPCLGRHSNDKVASGEEWRRSGGGVSLSAAELGVAAKESAEEKEKTETSFYANGWTARWRKPRDMSLVAVARVGVADEATATADAAAEGGRSQVLAWLQEAESGSNKQPGGKPKLAAAWVMGKQWLSERLRIELERREMTASKLQSMGSPKMGLTVTLGPIAK
jgi:hypothetical protein